MTLHATSLRTVSYLTPLHFDSETGYLGGGERYPRNLARAVHLASGGAVNVELVTFAADRGCRDLEPGVRLRTILPNGPTGANETLMSWELPAVIAGADMVHIHQALTRFGQAGLLSARLQAKPVCLTDHGGGTTTTAVAELMLQTADSLVAYSDFGASMLPTKRHVAVVKGGVDDGYFTPPSQPIAREHLMFVGRLLPHKGVDQLITALPNGVRLLICGRPYDLRYHALLQSLAVGRDVHFIADADDNLLRDLYRRAFGVVLPSVYLDCFGNRHRAPELMGFTLLEAMACGTPALCNNVAAMPEFVEDGVTGYVYTSLADLGAKLARLASEPELVSRLGAAARRTVEERYGLLATGAAMLDVYQRMARPMAS